MTVFEVVIYYYEGESQSLGLYSSREKAKDELDLAKDDWASGPNVESIEILERGLE